MKLYISIIAIILAKVSNACSCFGKDNIAAQTKRSNSIFIGKIISKEDLIKKDKLGNDIFFNTYSFYLIYRYKGRAIKKKMKIVTGYGNGDCGFNFVVGETYIIYGTTKDKQYKRNIYNDICYKTTNVNDTNEIKILNQYFKRNY